MPRGSCLLYIISHNFRAATSFLRSTWWRLTGNMGVILLLTTRCPTQPCYQQGKPAFFTPPKRKKELKVVEGVCVWGGDCDKTSRCFFLPPDKGNFLHCFSLMHRCFSPESLVSSLQFRKLLFPLRNWCLARPFHLWAWGWGCSPLLLPGSSVSYPSWDLSSTRVWLQKR